MSLRNYVIRCYYRGCANQARFKIASRWSDGITSELKTYSLCCDDCLEKSFQESVRRQTGCRLAEGETLETPGVYQLNAGHRDQELTRLVDVERALARKA
jgi:hypothetical protein